MEKLTPKNRKLLKTRMARALQDNMASLSIEMQKILVDDLVTAFENRLTALSTRNTVEAQLAEALLVA